MIRSIDRLIPAVLCVFIQAVHAQGFAAAFTRPDRLLSARITALPFPALQTCLSHAQPPLWRTPLLAPVYSGPALVASVVDGRTHTPLWTPNGARRGTVDRLGCQGQGLDAG